MGYHSKLILFKQADCQGARKAWVQCAAYLLLSLIQGCICSSEDDRTDSLLDTGKVCMYCGKTGLITLMHRGWVRDEFHIILWVCMHR